MFFVQRMTTARSHGSAAAEDDEHLHAIMMAYITSKLAAGGLARIGGG